MLVGSAAKARNAEANAPFFWTTSRSVALRMPFFFPPQKFRNDFPARFPRSETAAGGEGGARGRVRKGEENSILRETSAKRKMDGCAFRVGWR